MMITAHGGQGSAVRYSVAPTVRWKKPLLPPLAIRCLDRSLDLSKQSVFYPTLVKVRRVSAQT